VKIHQNRKNTNEYNIIINNTILYFSYSTLVAVSQKDKLIITKNRWGATTGKHLNNINPDKSIRIDYSDFKQEIDKLTI
jgi:hypothetical protein